MKTQLEMKWKRMKNAKNKPSPISIPQMVMKMSFLSEKSEHDGRFLTHGSSEGRFVSQCHHACRNCSSGLLPWRTNMQFEQCATARAHRRRHINYTSQFKPTVYSN